MGEINTVLCYTRVLDLTALMLICRQNRLQKEVEDNLDARKWAIRRTQEIIVHLSGRVTSGLFIRLLRSFQLKSDCALHSLAPMPCGCSVQLGSAWQKIVHEGYTHANGYGVCWGWRFASVQSCKTKTNYHQCNSLFLFGVFPFSNSKIAFYVNARLQAYVDLFELWISIDQI